VRALAGTFAIWIAGHAVAQEQAPAPRPELWRVVERIAAESGFQADLDAVVADLEGVAREYSMPHRTSRVARGLREPWAVPEIAGEIRSKLSSPFAPGGAGGTRSSAPVHWDGFVSNVASLCDVELAVEEPEAWKTVVDPTVRDGALVEALAKLAAALDEMARSSFGQIDAERQKDLAAAQREFMAIDFKTSDPKVEATPEEEAAQNALQKDLRKARIGPSLDAAAIALRLAEPAFLAALPERLKGLAMTAVSSAEFGGDVIAIFGDSPSTRVVIGGRGKTSYRGGAAMGTCGPSTEGGAHHDDQGQGPARQRADQGRARTARPLRAAQGAEPAHRPAAGRATANCKQSMVLLWNVCNDLALICEETGCD